MGYTDNPQNYIVDVYKYAVEETWKFTKKETSHTQYFNHFVSLQYIEISEANLTTSLGYLDSPESRVPKDFWYPFYIRSNSHYIKFALSVAVLSVSAVMF
jgi:hypothetical protein